MSRPIENLNLTVKTYAALKRSGINNVEEFLALNSEGIVNLKNISRKSMEEIERKLQICNSEEKIKL